ncbi:glycoside hydrolase family 35 protein [Alkalicoccobacillus murimartini]|uniref:Beta-galactosidase n=1 Tax=Alkalicoccobacillus murimartini TaxID=171685 RepID=A0ABT9YMW2_9BACI|nr:glycoside hydrolase family 35 protein [Alkalicoccobacillus murimartini]MDQ0209096.1 beta-galactosidase [Alkalicoccobacillus murimartini]
MLKAENGEFLLDGKPFQVLSGAIHYFRTVPEYWEDRLRKLKALGLNTVETYVPWNVHEPKKGEFHFSDLADIETFIKKAQMLDLYVIVRPAPYICAEWEMGGLPAWLLAEQDMVLRSSHPGFLRHISDYFDVLLPKIEKYLSKHGGPIIAMQIENEYGAYGNDHAYLELFKEQYQKHGIDTFLFTSDGPDFIEQGSLPNVTTTLNFGSRVEEAFGKLEEYKPGSPKMVAEFWIGWFDHWGGEHHTRDPKDVANVFEDLLKINASLNVYMFHGGTNFGFMNGANHYDEYYPTITSYDYDSLLSESGEITQKYREVKNVLRRYVDVPEDVEHEIPTKTYGSVKLEESVSLFDTLQEISTVKENLVPLSMEDAGQAYGFILYSTEVNRKGELNLDTEPFRDRAYVYVNGKLEKTIYINDQEKTVQINFPDDVNTLEILVENMGRANYGQHLTDKKGLIRNIWLGEQYWFHWTMNLIELNVLPSDYAGGKEERFPKFFQGTFDANECHDTFVDTKGFRKGNVFINGFNLGRYWNEMGPQRTLYLPGPLLKEKGNTITVLELEGTTTEDITLVDRPNLG